MDDWKVEEEMWDAFLHVIRLAERWHQAAAFRTFGQAGTETRCEVKFVDGSMSKPEAKRRGFQMIVFAESVWTSQDT